MKKIFIALILTLFFMVALLIDPTETKAETPDFFLMNEIYLYNYESFNFSPNFDNDYLMKATILPTDIETSIGAFIGWYKDLGYWNLLVPWFGEDVDNNHQVYFAIPLHGVLAANFQLGYSAQTPYEISFGVGFSDGTTQTWNTETNGYNKQMLVINDANLTKSIDYFWWEAKTPDYIPSFKFLGVTDGYDIGFEQGNSDGFTRGYQSGYNYGYQSGYNDGIDTSDEIIYEKILNFNQLIQNGNFESGTDWWALISSSYAEINTEDHAVVITSRANGGAITNYGIIQNTNNIISGHQYYLKVDLKASVNTFAYFYFAASGNNINLGAVGTTKATYTTIITALSDSTTIRLSCSITGDLGDSYEISNFNLIDLTRMYGEGFEPNISQCNTMFTTDYYTYTTGEPLEIGYYTGYYTGRDQGINEGINIGESNQISMGWVQSIFAAIQGVLNIQILPKVTIGVVVGIPFVISLAWFIIKMFRGGGGGD